MLKGFGLSSANVVCSANKVAKFLVQKSCHRPISAAKKRRTLEFIGKTAAYWTAPGSRPTKYFGNATNFLLFCGTFGVSTKASLSNMDPVKVNIFISHSPADKPVADKLLEWLYPMRDEVNVWHYDPPQKPEKLTPSWEIISYFSWEPFYFMMKNFFGWKPFDPLGYYKEKINIRRENAHIYIFLTSYKSLKDRQVEQDLKLAVGRRVECVWGDLAPLILPVLVSPSLWKEESPLARFKPLAEGMPLSSFPVPEDGYLLVTEQIAAFVKKIQVRLNEVKFYQNHPTNENNLELAPKHSFPYLGGNPNQFVYNPPATFRPPDWMGWSLIALIFTISAGSFRKNHPAVSSLHLKARPAKEVQPEYPRAMPLMPPPAKEEIVLPPVE